MLFWFFAGGAAAAFGGVVFFGLKEAIRGGGGNRLLDQWTGSVVQSGQRHNSMTQGKGRKRGKTPGSALRIDGKTGRNYMVRSSFPLALVEVTGHLQRWMAAVQ